MKKIRLLGTDKIGKTFAGHELGKNLFIEEVWVNILSVKDHFILQDGFSVDKTGKFFCRYDPYVVYLILYILRLTSKKSFLQDMFENSPAVILHYYMQQVLVGEWCRGAEDGVGGGLGKCLLHDDIGLAGFVVEQFSHRRDQKVKK